MFLLLHLFTSWKVGAFSAENEDNRPTISQNRLDSICLKHVASVKYALLITLLTNIFPHKNCFLGDLGRSFLGNCVSCCGYRNDILKQDSQQNKFTCLIKHILLSK